MPCIQALGYAGQWALMSVISYTSGVRSGVLWFIFCTITISQRPRIRTLGRVTCLRSIEVYFLIKHFQYQEDGLGSAQDRSNKSHSTSLLIILLVRINSNLIILACMRAICRALKIARWRDLINYLFWHMDRTVSTPGSFAMCAELGIDVRKKTGLGASRKVG